MRAAVVLLLCLAGAAIAQPPRAYFPWWDSPLARDMNLTDAQKEQIREIQRQYRDEMIDQRAALEKAEARLEDFYNEPFVDETAVRQVIDELIEARSALTRSITMMSLELRKVLTLDQWTSLQTRLKNMRERRFSGRRPGGPRGASGKPAEPPRGPAPDGGPPPQE